MVRLDWADGGERNGWEGCGGRKGLNGGMGRMGWVKVKKKSLIGKGKALRESSKSINSYVMNLFMRRICANTYIDVCIRKTRHIPLQIILFVLQYTKMILS